MGGESERGRFGRRAGFALVAMLVLSTLAVPASAAATTSDLALKTTAPASVPEEHNFTFKLVVANGGPDEAQNVGLEYTIPPASATFVTASISQGSGTITLATGTLIVNFGSIASGASASLEMTYRAVARGSVSFAPTTSFNPVGTQQDPNLGNNAAAINVAVTGLRAVLPSFAAQQLGTLGPAQALTLVNESSEPVTFGTLPVTGAAAADFLRVSPADTCAGATVAPGASCTVSLRFAPSDVGSRAAHIDFTPVSGPVDPLGVDFSANGTPLPAPVAATGPAVKLVLASAVKRLASRHGRAVTLAYASTLGAPVVLEVLKGKKRIARVDGSAQQGANRIRWNAKSHGKPAKAGRYALRLTATAEGQTAALTVPLTLR